MWTLSLLRVVSVFFVIGGAFAVEELTFSVKEEEDIGSLVGILLPKLSNRLQNYKHRMNFQLIRKDQARFFRISPQDGRITIAQPIDRETICQNDNSVDGGGYQHSTEGQCQLRFTVSVLREGTSEIIDIIQVSVNVLDVNDNKCRFEPSDHQTIYIPEDTLVDSGYPIPIYMPTDPDAGIMNCVDPRSIQLKSEDDINSARYFELHVTKTNSIAKPVSLHLTVKRKLDYESFPVHKLLVTANDASRYETSTCSLFIKVQVIDVNDNPPQFDKKQIHLSLNETTPVGSIVYQLHAKDLDKGPVFWRLFYMFGPYTPKDVLTHFEVIPWNGSIILKNRLSYTKKRKFEMALIVRNPVDAEISRASPKEEPKIRLLADTPLEATPHDIANLVVDVIDANDEAPVISFYAPDGQSDLYIEENNRNLSSDFGFMSVTDGDSGVNGKVECRLSKNTTGLFRLVNMNSAQQMTEAGRETLYKLSSIYSFDREETTSITLVITCKDLGTPSRSTQKSLVVRIRDVNDNSPVFERQYVQVNVTEDSDPVRRRNDFIIGQFVAHDPDEGVNAEITYEILQPTGQPLFTINPKTGVFSSDGHLDREFQDRHQFTIVARDSGLPQLSSSISVTVNVLDFNDEPPVFSLPEFEFTATEGVPLGTLVGTVDVTDADEGKNRELGFKILANDLSAHYALGGEEGLNYGWRQGHPSKLPYRLESRLNHMKNKHEVSIYTDGELDAEETQPKTGYSSEGSPGPFAHSFFVVAEDGGAPKRISRARITVNILDINDNSPIFQFPTESNASANVSYKEFTGYPFTRVHATDRDSGINGTVQYFFKTTDALKGERALPERGVFQIDRFTGQISLKTAMAFSDNNRAFQVVVVASDMGARPLQTDATLTIRVDNSSPKGGNGVRLWGSQGFGKNMPDSMINFFIIIFIVAAAFIISAVLLIAVCIVMRTSRHNSANSNTIPKQKNRFGPPHPPPTAGLEQEDALLNDPENNQMFNGFSSPCSYALSHSGGQVYHAIPLMTADQWAPSSSSSSALVYTTLKGVNWTAEKGASGAGGGGGGSDIFALAPGSCCNSDLIHPSTHQCLSNGALSESISTYRTGTTPLQTFEQPFWTGSQEHLNEQFVMKYHFDGPLSTDQDSGHGDSLDTNGTVFMPKSSIQSRCRSPLVSAAILDCIPDEKTLHNQTTCAIHPENAKGNSWSQPPMSKLDNYSTFI